MKRGQWGFTALSPAAVRRIDNGRYWLFDEECSADAMAAYERLWVAVNVQKNGDIVMAWVVTTTLFKGDTLFGERLREALIALGWQP